MSGSEVGYLYWEEPGEPWDSGRRVYEAQADADDPSNFQIHALGTLLAAHPSPCESLCRGEARKLGMGSATAGLLPRCVRALAGRQPIGSCTVKVLLAGECCRIAAEQTGDDVLVAGRLTARLRRGVAGLPLPQPDAATQVAINPIQRLIEFL
jgi:hypothetical protein